MIQTTFTVPYRDSDLTGQALSAISDYYTAFTPLDRDWQQQPPNIPTRLRIIRVELTGETEIDLEDGRPSYQARVQWEET